MGLFFHSHKIYTTITVKDTYTGKYVYNKTTEGTGVSFMSPFYDGTVEGMGKGLKERFPEPRYLIEVETMKD